MANRQSLRRDSERLGLHLLAVCGRELRVARLTSGLRQVDVGERLGRSASHVSRVEHGLIRTLTLPALARHAAVVGLRPWIRLYPTGSRPLDRGQIALLEMFRSRIATGWRTQLEVPMPIAGDLRAADALISRPGCRCVVELITRLADLQTQTRAGRLKVRDLGADRLIVVVASTTTNRRTAAQAEPFIREAFPIRTRAALRTLLAGEDPGGDCLIFLLAPSHAT